MSLVFDFADIANRMNRAAKTEPMAVVHPGFSNGMESGRSGLPQADIDWDAVYSGEYDAALNKVEK